MNKGIQRKFSVRWFDDVSGEGVLRDTETMISYTFYACNFKHADSLYQQLVTNVSVEKGMTVFGTIPADIHTLKNCGIIEMSYPTCELILKHQGQPDYRDELFSA